MSIFDLSSNSGKKKPPKATPLSKEVPVAPVMPIGESQTKSNLERLKQLSTKLSSELEEVLQKSGQSKKDVEAFCQNPSNFTKEQWEEMQKKKDEVEILILGKQVNTRKLKQAESASKQRKGKTLGARRNWLDMR